MIKKPNTSFLDVYDLTVSEVENLIQEEYGVPKNKFIFNHEPPWVHVDVANGDNVLFSVEISPFLDGVKLRYKSSAFFAQDYISDFEKKVLEFKKSKRSKYRKQYLEKQPPNPKQNGRYRLTLKEVKSRKEIVKKANKMKKENPLMYWKQIAIELDIPERTLRYYRHQYYK